MREHIINDLKTIFQQSGEFKFYDTYLYYEGKLPLTKLVDYIIYKMEENKNDTSPLEPKCS